MEIVIKRIQDPPDAEDGLRVLIDRAWPKGVAKESAAVDVWAQNAAPSEKLKKWFGAGTSEKWKEFRKRYHAELAENPAAVADIAKLASLRRVTFLHSAKDDKQNVAVALRDYLLKHADRDEQGQ